MIYKSERYKKEIQREELTLIYIAILINIMVIGGLIVFLCQLLISVMG